MPFRRLSVIWASVAVAAVALLSSAHAQLEITITSGVDRQIPIAIVPFAWEGPGTEPPFDVDGLIEQDLVNSGYFESLDERFMITQPTDPTRVNFTDWRLVDVDVLLIGRLIEDRPGGFTIAFQLFDVIRGSQLLGFRVTSDQTDLRATSHRIADMVFEELTGIRGIFSTRIAYISEQRRSPEDRTFRLIVADADGENASTIVESSQPLMSPAWSPDGRRIAYVSFDNNRATIYVQTLRTGTRDRVSARAGINGAPAFSPDGRQLALTLSQDGNLDVYTLELANQQLHRITSNAAIDTEPVWSADGRYLFFTSDRAGAPQIYRVAAEPGSRAERVTREGTYNSDASISPDGERIAVVHLNQDRYRIAVVDPVTGVTNVLSRGSLDESPSFAPNGATLIYATSDGGRGTLATVSADGRIHQDIKSEAGDVREPVWSPFPPP